ncbi:tRNA1(Val) (adenine(37)-N6)-methyltransferase [Pinisolibacter sp.]|uniref:tRNA1(Val) (adenine(37)-N6)-methyltransferase n=1 Tax=Pinisolibacter sp. TaxID=2172024 RepID=UPI002FDD25BE
MTRDPSPLSPPSSAGDVSTPGAPATSATTIDRFLDGRLVVEQPAKGRHRAGLDAILLAATVADGASGLLVDLGAGVGTAGLAAAVGAPGLEVRLAERDPEVLRLAEANIVRNGLVGRVETIAVDLLGPAKAREAVLPRECAAHVVCNPPFHAPGAVRASPRQGRAAAHVLAEGGLADWVRVAAATLRPHGRLSLIFEGGGLGEIVAALAGRFGAASIRPIHPREDAPAHRLLVTAVKGSRARPAVLPGLVLHPAGSNAYLPQADAVLRGTAGLGGGREDLTERA